MCGIGYIFAKDTNGVAEAQDGAVVLNSLKHRGSDAAGAIISSGGTGYTEIRTNLGVDENFLAMARLMRVHHPGVLQDARQDVRVCLHNRYTTDDDAHNPHNGQPMRVGDKGARLKLAFNGNAPNHLEIRKEKLAGEVSFQTLGDTETLARFMLQRILTAMQTSSGNVRHSIREAVKEVLDVFRGGYSVVGDFGGEVFAFKDAYGIRPLALGRKNGAMIMASEDYFFPEIGYEYSGELPNGHLLMVGPGDSLDGEYTPEPENLLTENITAHPDCFEFVYLANRLSKLFGVSVEKIRKSLGAYAIRELLQTPGNHTYGKVIAVPNGANDMKKGARGVLGLSNDTPNGLKKVLDVRTFIARTQEERERLVAMKFRTIPEGIDRESNLLIDDSIVRGTTMKVLAKKLDESGAGNIQVLSSSPMVQFGDRYGIAMSTTQLVARDESDGRILTTEEIEGKLFYDRNGRQFARLFFPSLAGFRQVFADHGIPKIHDGYFSGEFCNG
ncbi:hypothetical protein KA071_02905 [Candidatus Gracilibacteria bacterium]|nr:hypothetical protein [Candidatus Gracilibacteria bacterium]